MRLCCDRLLYAACWTYGSINMCVECMSACVCGVITLRLLIICWDCQRILSHWNPARVINHKLNFNQRTLRIRQFRFDNSVWMLGAYRSVLAIRLCMLHHIFCVDNVTTLVNRSAIVTSHWVRCALTQLTSFRFFFRVLIMKITRTKWS